MLLNVGYLSSWQTANNMYILLCFTLIVTLNFLIFFHFVIHNVFTLYFLLWGIFALSKLTVIDYICNSEQKVCLIWRDQDETETCEQIYKFVSTWIEIPYMRVYLCVGYTVWGLGKCSLAASYYHRGLYL